MTVGQVLDAVGGAVAATSAQRVVLTPSGRRLPIEDEGSDVVELTEKGFYELRGDGNQSVTVVAVERRSGRGRPDADRSQGNRGRRDGRVRPAARAAQPTGVPLTPEAKERNQRLWWYLLVAGILLLGVDTLLSNRMAKT